MKRLLIVDDEHHVVNRLADLFEEQDDMNLAVLKAYGGKEALQILENVKIDVMLLDIKMPGIDGLAVAEKVLKDWPLLRIIFLTGHDQFDYAYYANRHKNISLLLKMEREEEIIGTVADAIRNIDSEKKLLELSAQATSKEQMITYFLQRDFFRDVLKGKFPGENEGREMALNLDKPVILLLGKLDSFAADSYAEDPGSYILKSMQVMEQILYDKFRYAMLDYDRTTIVWFLQPEPSENRKQSSILLIKEFFDDILAFYQQNFSSRIMLLLYHKVIEWKNVCDTFLRLNQFALQRSRQQPTGAYGMIYRESDENCILHQGQDETSVDRWELLLDEMTGCLSRGDQKQLIFLVKQLVFSTKDIKSMHYLPLIGIYQRISYMLIQYINKYDLMENIAARIGLYPLYYLHDFENWGEAFAYLEKLIIIIFELNYDRQLSKNQRLVQNIQDYIHGHLSDDLNLMTLSDVVNYNSSYVSRIFKQTTNMNLSDYVTACRISRAKELLHNTEDSINVIAEKVGFDTSQYFCMVFRNKVGMTPGEYRNQ